MLASSFATPSGKFLNKIAENCTMKVSTRSGIKLKIGAVVTVCKTARARYLASSVIKYSGTAEANTSLVSQKLVLVFFTEICNGSIGQFLIALFQLHFSKSEVHYKKVPNESH